MTPGQREVPATQPTGGPQSAEYWHTRWQAALEQMDAEAVLMHQLSQRALAAMAERDAAVSALTRVRELHPKKPPKVAGDEAGCPECADAWPCPTMQVVLAALPPVDSPEDTNGTHT